MQSLALQEPAWRLKSLVPCLLFVPQVYEARYRSAQAVMHELSNSIRQALQEGYVFVLPTTPGEAPPSGDAEQVAAFRQRSLEFAALATLAGVPQVSGWQVGGWHWKISAF